MTPPPRLAPDGGSEIDVDALREAVAALVDGWPDIDETVMFGCPSFRADGELFAVVSDQGLSLTKLPDDERDRLADDYGVQPFDAGGRQVSGWATVAVVPEAVETLEEYVRASYDVARES